VVQIGGLIKFNMGVAWMVLGLGIVIIDLSGHFKPNVVKMSISNVQCTIKGSVSLRDTIISTCNR